MPHVPHNGLIISNTSCRWHTRQLRHAKQIVNGSFHSIDSIKKKDQFNQQPRSKYNSNFFFYRQPHLHKRKNYLRTTGRCTLFTTIRISHAFRPCDVAAEKSAGNSNCCRNRALSGSKSFSYCFPSSGTSFHSFQKDLEWFVQVFGRYQSLVLISFFRLFQLLFLQ